MPGLNPYTRVRDHRRMRARIGLLCGVVGLLAAADAHAMGVKLMVKTCGPKSSSVVHGVPMNPVFAVRSGRIVLAKDTGGRSLTVVRRDLAAIPGYEQVQVVVGAGVEFHVNGLGHCLGHEPRFRTSIAWKRPTRTPRIRKIEPGNRIEVELERAPLQWVMAEWAYSRAELDAGRGQRSVRLVDVNSYRGTWSRPRHFSLASLDAESGSRNVFIRFTPVHLDGTVGPSWRGWIDVQATGKADTSHALSFGRGAVPREHRRRPSKRRVARCLRRSAVQIVPPNPRLVVQSPTGLYVRTASGAEVPFKLRRQSASDLTRQAPIGDVSGTYDRGTAMEVAAASGTTFYVGRGVFDPYCPDVGRYKVRQGVRPAIEVSDFSWGWRGMVATLTVPRAPWLKVEVGETTAELNSPKPLFRHHVLVEEHLMIGMRELRASTVDQRFVVRLTPLWNDGVTGKPWTGLVEVSPGTDGGDPKLRWRTLVP